MKVETGCRGIKYAFKSKQIKPSKFHVMRDSTSKGMRQPYVGVSMCLQPGFLATFPRRLLASRLISADKKLRF